jgi:putative membrane-bound dehydrogenase-like protein
VILPRFLRLLSGLVFAAATTVLLAHAVSAAPLRVFIRSGPKTHGPGAHDHPRFLAEWTTLLTERGVVARGAARFPSAEELADTDVLILHAPEAGNIAKGDEREALDGFLRRGGGIVVIHAAAVSRDPDWYRTIIGGSWRFGTTRWLEGPLHLYFTDRVHPITTGASNWAMDDEIYYDLDLQPEARVLAAAYTPKASGARNAAAQKRADELTGGGKKVSVYDYQPQMWTYERTLEGAQHPYRAFVSLPGHYYATFNRPNYRALLLRGIAWAAGQDNVDVLCRPEELGDGLRYVEGGPVSPAKAAATLEVHPEFTATLVAAEPLVTKVMNIDWDERGRLWVGETPEYPNGRRVPNVTPWKETGSLHPTRTDRPAEDRISWLEDSNGDGVMDRKVVFADGLELVTGFVLYRRGVIAATAPDIWFLEDTDGDGRADRRTKLYTGLGIADTHAVINNLRWGLDGWIYATHGYSRGEVTSPDGRTAFGVANNGVVRFKPDGSAFEQYSSRGGNTWGLEITWDGQVIWTQPTTGTVLFHTLLPESILAKGRIPGTTSWKGMITGQRTYPLMNWTEQAYVQIDQVGRFTAAAGCAIYDGGAWPDRWKGSYFTGEPTLNIVHHQFLRPEGPSFRTEKEAGFEETEFIRSRDLWFRPIETRIGPDGALYVVDFYNQAVIHNDTRGPVHGPANAALRPDRDHHFARIWRIQHREARVLPDPQLDARNAASLVRAIDSHPNQHVRATAWRLLRENFPNHSALASPARRMGSTVERTYEEARSATTDPARRAVLDRFAAATDDWTRSALVAAATDHPAELIAAALADTRGSVFAPFVSAVLPALPAKGRAMVVTAAASSPSDALASTALRGLMAAPALAGPADADELAALRRLLQRPGTAVAALPLAVRDDRDNRLVDLTDPLTASLLARIVAPDTAEPDRLEAALSLLALPARRTAVLERVTALLTAPGTPAKLQTPLLAALGAIGGDDAGRAVIVIWAGTRTPAAFDQILRRVEFTRLLLADLAEGRINPASLSLGDVARLRTHPNRDLAREAAALMAKLNPVALQKDELIARLTPEVEKPGDFARGRAIYAAACAVCHRHNDVGLVDIGPPLSGMGAHGPATLLVHILDPNREVDPSFWQWNITTKKGETLSGIIVSENAAGLTLRSLGGDHELRSEDIATRENTRRSLMPEGFEGMGSEGLRDLLTYLASADQGFRVLDLRDAYTANSRRGMFRREDATAETIAVQRFGDVKVHGVPFFVMDSAKSATGRNVLALKGGPGSDGFSEDYPRRVVLNVNAAVSSVQLLSGLGGGAWPQGGDAAKGQPVLSVTAVFADGTREEHVLRNGIHFAHYESSDELTGAKAADGFTRAGRARLISLPLRTAGLVRQLELESYDNDVVPCTLAVTVELSRSTPTAAPSPSGTHAAAAASAPTAANLGPQAKANPGTATATTAAAAAIGPREGGKGDQPLPKTQPVRWKTGQTRVMLIGGGSSHDFAAYFNAMDRAILQDAGFTVHYTEDRDQAATELASADVAVVSVNRKHFDTPEYRAALMAFAQAGKGIVLLHAGTWFAYPQWPELNAALVGGGSRGHDRLGAFTVRNVQPGHPVMRGVPERFEVTDELYYVNAEPARLPPGTAPIEILAETSPSQKYGVPHPSVWITRHPQARVVGIALGHDQRTHEHPAFRALLNNAVRWSARRE